MEGLGCASGALVQLHGIVKDGGERGRLAVCEVPVYFFPHAGQAVLLESALAKV